MNSNFTSGEEIRAAEAFSRQSDQFDALYGPNLIIQYKRKRVRDHVLSFLSPGATILELNSGTGEDAVWFARQGFSVHGTDISAGMQKQFLQKTRDQQLQNRVSHELCSFTALDQLKNRGPYDFIFSNFAGLNCTPHLDKVIDSFDPLLKPGGWVTLVLLPRFCIWETLLIFKAKFRTAFRRFVGNRGASAHISGVPFRCWYYNPSYVRRRIKNNYDFGGCEGLCALVPPSYFENFPDKRPRLYKRLQQLEEKWKNVWPWRSVGDYYIISFRKKIN